MSVPLDDQGQSDFLSVHKHVNDLIKEERYVEAEAILRPILASAGLIMFWHQLAVVLRMQGRYAEATTILDKVVEALPGNIEARFDLAELLLQQGQFDRGWREYRFRYKLPHTRMLERHVQKPRWEGQPIPGKTLLIHDEQGFGDSFQFLRLVAWARQRSGAQIILEVKPEIHSPVRRYVGHDLLITRGTLPPAFDYHCEMMSLPKALNLQLGDLPGTVPYLSADPARCDKWQARLAGLRRPIVGLVWAGSSIHPNDIRRSIPLADFAPLANTGVTFVAVQKGPAATQAAAPPAGMPIISLSDEIEDFEDTAAILSIIDLLISVDSSPVHLAGALGRPVWIPLPFVHDWRWLAERTDSPWYPSLRLFRQGQGEEWTAVLARIAAALSERFAKMNR